MESIEHYMPSVMEQIVTEINNLMASAQVLTPLIQESGEKKHLESLSIMTLCHYRLLRTAWHLEIIEKLNQSSIEKNLLDLATVCHELCAEVEPLAAKVGVRFTCTEVPNTLLIMGDEKLLKHMLLNLISNAMQSAGIGGETGLRLVVAQGRAVVSIWDNGPKAIMPKEETQKDRFVLERNKGLGAGWEIVHKIANAHGGTMVFGCGEERGNQAVVSLDAAVPKKVDKPALHTPKKNFDPTGGYSITLVELSDALPFKAFMPEDVE